MKNSKSLAVISAIALVSSAAFASEPAFTVAAPSIAVTSLEGVVGAIVTALAAIWVTKKIISSLNKS